MQSTVFLIICAVGSMLVSLTVTVFYKRIRGKLWKNNYKLPDEIPLCPELMDIPDKNNFLKSSYMLDSGTLEAGEQSGESVVEALITDESAKLSGFNLRGENVLLECLSPDRAFWHEVSDFPFIIGKSRECDLCLAEEDAANEMHGILYMKDSRYFYLDMNSMNGSIVDDKLSIGVTEITNGSRIQICQTTLRFLAQEI